jgi:hypothetical protein
MIIRYFHHHFGRNRFPFPASLGAPAAGAEFAQVYAARAGSAFKPSEYAVRVETREVETG